MDDMKEHIHTNDDVEQYSLQEDVWGVNLSINHLGESSDLEDGKESKSKDGYKKKWSRDKSSKSFKKLKSKDEVQLLEAYFRMDPLWGRQTVKELKYQLTSLTVDQIYKWGYDRKLLIKKNIAKDKAKQNFDQKCKEFDLSKLKCSIDDYNKEVANLCKFHLNSLDSNQFAHDAPSKRSKFIHSWNINKKGQVELCDEKELLTDDDPYFYNPTDDSQFYM